MTNGGRLLCAIAIVLTAGAAFSVADDAAPPDKSSFTLFNPTPAADLRDIDTDRPDKTNSPRTIDAGHLQIEFGLFDYLYDRNRYQGANARTDFVTAGQFALRLGVLNNLELDTVINPYVFDRETDYAARHSTRQNSFGDTVIGASYNFWGNDNSDGVWQTALAIQPQLKLPTARRDVGNGYSELQVGLPFTMNLPANLQLNAETAGSWERNSAHSGYVAAWENSISLDVNIAGKLDAYFEYWAHVSTERHQEAQQTFDTGLVWGFNERVVFDTGVALGLNHASPSVEWTAGATVRF